MAHRLEQLLPELLIELVKYLPRPSDRGNLCLLSKSLYDCVLPILYYTIALDTSSSCVQPDADAGLLRIGNPGIEHVRNFSILATKGVQDCENEARFLRMFLLALPCDTLKHLECSTLSIDETTIFTLLAQQRNLESIALGPVMCHFERMVKRNGTLWSNLKGLALPSTIGSHDWDAYQHIIERAPHLTAIEVSCKATLDRPAGQIQDLKVDSDHIEQSLFSCTDRKNTTTTTMKITKLVLEGIQIRRGLPKCFNISHLQSLSLWHCTDAHKALEVMNAAISQGHRCNLREFSYRTAEGEILHRDQVQTLLQSFTGLQKLALMSHDAEQLMIVGIVFGLQSLENHKNTLETLILGCNHIDDGADQRIIDLDFAYLATFTKLRQLGVPMPPIVLPSTANHGIELNEYTSAFKILTSNLPHLHTLRILNFSGAVPGAFIMPSSVENFIVINPINTKVFCSDLDEFVNEELAPHMHRIKVLSIGGDDGTSNDVVKIEVDLVFYVAEQRRDVFGKFRASASRSSFEMACLVEPELALRSLAGWKAV